MPFPDPLPDKKRGQPLYAEHDWNALLRRMQRMESAITGLSGRQHLSTGGGSFPAVGERSDWRLARIDGVLECDGETYDRFYPTTRLPDPSQYFCCLISRFYAVFLKSKATLPCDDPQIYGVEDEFYVNYDPNNPDANPDPPRIPVEAARHLCCRVGDYVWLRHYVGRWFVMSKICATIHDKVLALLREPVTAHPQSPVYANWALARLFVNNSGTLTTTAGPAQLSLTNHYEMAVNRSDQDFEANQVVMLEWMNGEWLITGTHCEPLDWGITPSPSCAGTIPPIDPPELPPPLPPGDPAECDEWRFAAHNGASWSGAASGWNIQVNFEDSANCGGSNNTTQAAQAERCFDVASPTTVSIVATGLVERQNAGFEQLAILMDGAQFATGTSYEDHLGCQMAPATASGSIVVAAGHHVITVIVGTVDPLFHVGAYWNFLFTFV